MRAPLFAENAGEEGELRGEFVERPQSLKTLIALAEEGAACYAALRFGPRPPLSFLHSAPTIQSIPILRTL